MNRLPAEPFSPAPRDLTGNNRKFAIHPEIQGLQRNLDAVYARLRQRARTGWLRSHAKEDPSDACVSVRITSGAHVPERAIN